MSLSNYRTTRPDRRFGIVLIVVFSLGILGATLATVVNGGHVPEAAHATVHLTTASEPL